MTVTTIKRALLSVSDKSGCVLFAKALHDLNVSIISTGGISALLREANIPHQQVDEITKWPEMLEGRVKTLHPKIHGGILGKRDEHAQEIDQHNIPLIDLVVVNFYPFEEAVLKSKTELSFKEAIEHIDIGGPTMVRAAAKNFAWVGVVTDPKDYPSIVDELKNQQGLTLSTKEKLAEKAFGMTAKYDAMVNHYFQSKRSDKQTTPQSFFLQLEKQIDLRYGENPHQKASAYRLITENAGTGLLTATQHQGKPLSYNNLLDADAACQSMQSFESPTCVIVKHANPCGVAQADAITAAYAKAYESDSKSAFGGIVALNRPCTLAIAQMITSIFMEVIIAPSFDEEALALFATKPNLRMLSLPNYVSNKWEIRGINGGVLLQEKDLKEADEINIVTQTIPSEVEQKELLFAWRVVKQIKSNAIVLTKDLTTVGIGCGQVSRIDAVDLALRKAADKSEGSVLASDAFFPFRDSIDRLAKTGVRAIIQPGGSVRDEEVIAACNELGIAMVFTGIRCFKH